MALRKCIHLDVKDGERLSRDKAYRCLAPDPVMPTMTAAMTMAYGFKWPPSRNQVLVDHHCGACPMFENRRHHAK